MKNYFSRLKLLEDKINPKTSLFRIFATNSRNEKILIKEQTITRLKGHDVVSLNIGRGIYSDEQIEEDLKNNQKFSKIRERKMIKKII